MQNTWAAILKGLRSLLFKFPLVLAFSVALYFTIVVLMDYKTDTTSISNGAFVIVASLAALSFSYAGALRTKEEEYLRGRLLLGGQKFFYSAVLLLLASVIKYGIILSKSKPDPWMGPALTKIFEVARGGTVGFLFSAAMISAQSGLRILYEQLAPSSDNTVRK